jgi:hypothetical protein
VQRHVVAIQEAFFIKSCQHFKVSTPLVGYTDNFATRPLEAFPVMHVLYLGAGNWHMSVLLEATVSYGTVAIAVQCA